MDTQLVESLLKFAVESNPKSRGFESSILFQQLEQQYTDLLATLQWFITQGHTEKSLRLASSLVTFWMATKRLDEGTAWLDQALALPGGDNAYRGGPCSMQGICFLER